MFSALSRYLVRLTFTPFAIATVVLTGIIWLTQALQLLDVVIAQGQGSGTFFLLTLLVLPTVLAIVLPIALFFGVLFALHKAYTDSELVVMFAAGVSRWGIALPILGFASLISVVIFLLNLYIMPAAHRELKTRIYDIRADIASSMIREGSFTNPISGLTVYVRERSGNGVIEGILVHDNRNPDEPITYMADTGQLIRSAAGPRLVMFNGTVQRVSHNRTSDPDAITPIKTSITVLHFATYTYDLSALAPNRNKGYLEARERYLWELFEYDPTDAYSERNRGKLLAELHDRLVSNLFPLMLASIAIASLISAEFNRRGYASRLVIAIVFALLARLLALGLFNMADSSKVAVVAYYMLPIGVIGMALASIAGVPFDRWVLKAWYFVVDRVRPPKTPSSGTPSSGTPPASGDTA